MKLKRQKLDDLNWKPVETGFGYEGLLSLEVVENYSPAHLENSDSQSVSSVGDDKNPTNYIFDDDPFAEDINQVLLGKWQLNHSFPGWCCPLPQNMLNFEPSEIQKQVFKWYSKNKRSPCHLLIGAQTGSGKTLSFLLPMIHRLTSQIGFKSALILAPTRELVNQITTILKELTAQYDNWSVVKIQGGMSQDKQDRMLANALRSEKVVLVSSPGRLGELSESLPVISVDEIDKIEEGEIKLLYKVYLNCEWLILDEFEKLKGLEGIDKIGLALRRVKTSSDTSNWSKSFFISCASATPNLESKLILGTVPFNPSICTINMKKNSNISHFHMDCVTLVEKDLSLYYLSHTYLGKTAVFLNSLDGVRRLAGTLRLLLPDRSIKTIRGDMKMGQRLKVLQDFKSIPNCILIASDVAARGLDIEDTECVVHYDIPRDVDIFIHRSGRTARYDRKGVSIALSMPEEFQKYRTFLKAVEISNSKLLSLENSICSHLKPRLLLAKQIEKADHEKRIKNANLSQQMKYDDQFGDELEFEKVAGKAVGRNMKKQLKDLLSFNIDTANRKKGTTVISPSMFKTFNSGLDSNSFLSLIK
eukprot:NODE_607_length_5446_cov_0.832055.p1 type:complete len:588 gc:universal NODE_607_length_5446_cov_0.832055:3800-2037(-)